MTQHLITFCQTITPTQSKEGLIGFGVTTVSGRLQFVVIAERMLRLTDPA
jgi:hypothetical protein